MRELARMARMIHATAAEVSARLAAAISYNVRTMIALPRAHLCGDVTDYEIQSIQE